MVGRPGFNGNKTNSAQSEAGARAELGNDLLPNHWDLWEFGAKSFNVGSQWDPTLNDLEPNSLN